MDFSLLITIGLLSYIDDSTVVQFASTCKALNNMTKTHPSRDIKYGVCVFAVTPLLHKAISVYFSRIIFRFLVDVMEDGLHLIINNVYKTFPRVDTFTVEVYNNRGQSSTITVSDGFSDEDVDVMILETALVKPPNLSFCITLPTFIAPPTNVGRLDTRLGWTDIVLLDDGQKSEIKGDFSNNMMIKFMFSW